MSLADRLRETRTEHLALTQPELADKLGIRPISVSRWERGVAKPSLIHLRAVAMLADKPVSWFFESSEEMAA